MCVSSFLCFCNMWKVDFTSLIWAISYGTTEQSEWEKTCTHACAHVLALEHMYRRV